MNIHIYESNEFIDGASSEQRIIVFEQQKMRNMSGLYTLEDFATDCMFAEIRYDQMFTKAITEKPWERHQKLRKELPKQTNLISNEAFLENLSITKQLRNPCPMPRAKILRCWSLFEQEWNYIFQVAELQGKFYGFTWSTTA